MRKAKEHATLFSAPHCARHIGRKVALLVTCDHVATLPGWVKSQGAQLEVYIAGRLGIRDSPAHTITEYQA